MKLAITTWGAGVSMVDSVRALVPRAAVVPHDTATARVLEHRLASDGIEVAAPGAAHEDLDLVVVCDSDRSCDEIVKAVGRRRPTQASELLVARRCRDKWILSGDNLPDAPDLRGRPPRYHRRKGQDGKSEDAVTGVLVPAAGSHPLVVAVPSEHDHAGALWLQFETTARYRALRGRAAALRPNPKGEVTSEVRLTTLSAPSEVSLTIKTSRTQHADVHAAHLARVLATVNELQRKWRVRGTAPGTVELAERAAVLSGTIVVDDRCIGYGTARALWPDANHLQLDEVRGADLEAPLVIHLARDHELVALSQYLGDYGLTAHLFCSSPPPPQEDGWQSIAHP